MKRCWLGNWLKRSYLPWVPQLRHLPQPVLNQVSRFRTHHRYRRRLDIRIHHSAHRPLDLYLSLPRGGRRCLLPPSPIDHLHTLTLTLAPDPPHRTLNQTCPTIHTPRVRARTTRIRVRSARRPIRIRIQQDGPIHPRQVLSRQIPRHHIDSRSGIAPISESGSALAPTPTTLIVTVMVVMYPLYSVGPTTSESQSSIKDESRDSSGKPVLAGQ